MIEPPSEANTLKLLSNNVPLPMKKLAALLACEAHVMEELLATMFKKKLINCVRFNGRNVYSPFRKETVPELKFMTPEMTTEYGLKMREAINVRR